MRGLRMQEVEEGRAMGVELPAFEAFAENNKTKFKVGLPSGKKLEVRLIDVSDRKVTPRHEEFSIMFRGPTGTLMPQGTYRLEHDKLGSFELFIVPIGKDEQGYL